MRIHFQGTLLLNVFVPFPSFILVSTGQLLLNPNYQKYNSKIARDVHKVFSHIPLSYHVASILPSDLVAETTVNSQFRPILANLLKQCFLSHFMIFYLTEGAPPYSHHWCFLSLFGFPLVFKLHHKNDQDQ